MQYSYTDIYLLTPSINTNVDVTVGLLSTNKNTRQNFQNRIASIICGSIKPNGMLSTGSTVVRNGEAGNGADIHIKIEGGEVDKSKNS